MSAICKTIEIHGDNLQPLLDYTSNELKTSLEENGLENLLSYAANEEKTSIILPGENEKSMLVTGVLCNPNTANEEFLYIRNKYREEHPENTAVFEYEDKKTNSRRTAQKSPVTAIHLIQSFKETNMDPIIANQIGVELCERLGVQACVDTHMNKEHIHNHIVINAYMPDGNSKFSMNNEKRIAIRRMSDEIQREFGLDIEFNDPELQQEISKGSLNYAEWHSKKLGTSWKDEMRQDIIAIREIADTVDEYKDIMSDYGYKVDKEKDGNIRWFNTNNDKVIWDKSLGDDYITSNLYNLNNKTPVIVEKPFDEIAKRHSKIIDISRYNIKGKRRTKLEMLIRRTIFLIQKVAKMLKNKKYPVNKNYNLNAKLDILQEALNTLEQNDIKDMDDLNKRIDDTGKNLNVMKNDLSRINSEVSYNDTISKLIQNYKDADTLYNSVKYWTDEHIDLYLNHYSSIEIGNNKAKICPLSSKQRSDLYMMMKKHPELRIKNAKAGFSNVNIIQYKQITDYFKGKTDKPDCLIDSALDNMDVAYERQYTFLKEKMNYDMSVKQKKEIRDILKEREITDIDVNKLTMADYINITNCYKSQPMNEQLISKEQQQQLQSLLDKNSITISRPLKYVMENEYNDIIKFYNKKIKRKPDILKDNTTPSDTDLDKTIKAMEKCNITTTVPIEYMNNKEVKNLYNWIISKDKQPMCINANQYNTKEEQLKLFKDDIKNETPRKQQVLINLRNAINDLKQYGIDIKDIDKIERNMHITKEKQSLYQDKKEELSNDYKKLLRLKQQISYSQDKKFIFTPLLSKKEIQEIENEYNKLVPDIDEIQNINKTEEININPDINKATIDDTKENKNIENTEDIETVENTKKKNRGFKI